MRILAIAAWLLPVLVFYVLCRDKPLIVRAREFHHLYLGSVLVLLGLVLGGWWWLGLLIGEWFCYDDVYQHVRQVEGRPDYQSFLHRVYLALARKIPLLVQLARLLDWLCGKRSATA